MLSKIKGKKTYLVALGAGVAAAASALGHPLPDWSLLLLNAAGLGAIRDAIRTPV